MTVQHHPVAQSATPASSEEGSTMRPEAGKNSPPVSGGAGAGAPGVVTGSRETFRGP